MNSKQQVALIIGLLALVMIWMVPPWLSTESDGTTQSMGYGPIWHPPVHTKTKGADILGLRFEIDESLQANTIDWSTLLGEGGVVLLVTAASVAILGLGKGNKPRDLAAT